MRPFPNLEDVFETVTDDIRELYLPAVSIDASVVDPSWTGPLHFVMPVEPFDGGLGEYASDAHENHYCRHNLIGFRRGASGRYQPLADPLFFTINCARKNSGLFQIEPHLDSYETLSEAEEFYAMVHASFADTQTHFESTGQLPQTFGKPSPWIYDLGGVAPAKALQTFVPDGRPLSPEGRAFRFVGDLNTYAFRRNGSDAFYMFFDPVDEIAWFSLAFS
jgi:hypothetical protein